MFWFAGGAVVLVWLMFKDPAFDYRLVVVGALLPDAVDAPLGGARVMHAVIASAAVLVVVMLATRGRRRLRRRLLAVPIAMFLHLVLDGAWTAASLFWWPFEGTSFHGARLPSVAHPVWLTAAEEVAGVGALVWCWVRFRLTQPERRARFFRTGYLGRDLADGQCPD